MQNWKLSLPLDEGKVGGTAARMRCDKHLANKRRKIIWYTITTNQNNFNELNRRPLFRRAYRGGNEKIILYFWYG